jgi:hypothetical protein
MMTMPRRRAHRFGRGYFRGKMWGQLARHVPVECHALSGSKALGFIWCRPGVLFLAHRSPNHTINTT